MVVTLKVTEDLVDNIVADTANYEKQLNKTWHSDVHGVDKLVYMVYIGLYKFILYFLAMCSKL